jgi:hypothetical protein
MSKLFTFAGTCTEKGTTVYKFANNAKRGKELERFGCTNVNMIELPFAMGKEAAVDYLGAQGITANKMPKVTKTATVKVTQPKGKVKIAKTTTDETDELSRDEYNKAVLQWQQDEMPVKTFAQWKRDTVKAQKFFAACKANLEAKKPNWFQQAQKEI